MNMTDDKASIQRTADKIRAARHAKNMTQVEVAQKAGISENHYAQIERGEKNPTTSTFGSIIDAIGVSPNDILGK
jgi:transcriptional regulator with XRE-family HTH domain